MFHATLWVRDLHDSRVNPSMKWCVSTIVSTSLSTIQFIKVRPGLGQAARVHHCVHHLRREKAEQFSETERNPKSLPTLDFIRKRTLEMVGPRGFEPLTFCTPSKRATRLRYGPKTANSISQSPDAVKGADSVFRVGVFHCFCSGHSRYKGEWRHAFSISFS